MLETHWNSVKVGEAVKRIVQSEDVIKSNPVSQYLPLEGQAAIYFQL